MLHGIDGNSSKRVFRERERERDRDRERWTMLGGKVGALSQAPKIFKKAGFTYRSNAGKPPLQVPPKTTCRGHHRPCVRLARLPLDYEVLFP